MATYEIDHYDPHHPQLIIRLNNGRVTSFTLAPVDKDSHEWLGSLLARKFQEEVDNAVADALYAHKLAMRKLLGI